jgi:hypothetical protein
VFVKRLFANRDSTQPFPTRSRSYLLPFLRFKPTLKTLMHYYQAYGLNLQSELPLPELPPGGDGSDVVIQSGSLTSPPLTNTHIPRQGREAWFGGDINCAYLHWPEIVTFCAQSGTRLIVDSSSTEIVPELLNLYVLSEALGMVLHQRGVFLLHASAIQIGQQVVVFVGAPGAGKSTTAAAFAQRGYPVLSDDMVAITFDATGQPLVLPGFPQIKVWQPSVQGLGYDATALTPLFPGSRKQVIRPFANFPSVAAPLAQILVLAPAETHRIEAIPSAQGVMTLTQFFPCPEGLLQGQALARHFQQCLQLLHHVPLTRLQQPRTFSSLNNVVTQLIADFSPPARDRANPVEV